MKKTLLAGIILVLLISLVGCNGDRTSTTNLNITNEEFYQAIKQLKPESQVSDSLINRLTLQQLTVKNKKDYYIAWTEHTTASPDLPLIAIYNENKEPIYVQSFRERIESVKYMGDFILDNGLIEVTSYGASGSFSGQWVDLLVLNDHSVKTVWEYQTIGNDSHLTKNEGVLEYLHDYSTYLIVPSYQQRFTEEQYLYIIVNQTSERILVSAEDKIISRNKDTNQLRFIWDDEQLRFVRKE